MEGQVSVEVVCHGATEYFWFYLAATLPAHEHIYHATQQDDGDEGVCRGRLQVGDDTGEDC